MFQASDCTLVEINPMVMTTGGNIVALDAKVVRSEHARQFTIDDVYCQREFESGVDMCWSTMQYLWAG